MQIASLNADLGSSKEREEQLSKKLAASWKEVSNISRECEALRLGGEEQEKGMDEAQEKLREFMLLVRDFEEKESLHQKHHAELQAAAFDMSSQLLMSDREVLRSRKELSRALAGEARVRSDADEQLKTLKVTCVLMLRYTCSSTHSFAHTRMHKTHKKHTHTRTHTHARARAHTHTHTQVAAIEVAAALAQEQMRAPPFPVRLYMCIAVHACVCMLVTIRKHSHK